MMEHDPLRPLLREWEAPEPPATMDARVLAAFRAAQRPSVWTRLWNWRVSLPVPVFAAAVIVIAIFLFTLRPAPDPAPVAGVRGHITRLDAAGFQPLPNGAARVVKVGEVAQ
jgi:anti-sigma-K factor RskA